MGAALLELGLIDESFADEGISVATLVVEVRLVSDREKSTPGTTRDLVETLARVQARQDAGMPWGVAILPLINPDVEGL
jgi:hypothetical protein